MINTAPSEILKLAISAALKAGQRIQHYKQNGFSTAVKPDGSPVTDADKAADEIIHSCLIHAAYPIISEEHIIAPYNERKLWNRVWLVDP